MTTRIMHIALAMSIEIKRFILVYAVLEKTERFCRIIKKCIFSGVLHSTFLPNIFSGRRGAICRYSNRVANICPIRAFSSFAFPDSEQHSGLAFIDQFGNAADPAAEHRSAQTL